MPLDSSEIEQNDTQTPSPAMKTDPAVVLSLAQDLKRAHVKAEVLGGDHQQGVQEAYHALLEAVSIPEPREVQEYREAVEREQQAAREQESENAQPKQVTLVGTVTQDSQARAG